MRNDFVQLLGIIARKFEAMAETYIRLKNVARRIGLVINVSKIEYMIAKGSREELPRPPLLSTVMKSRRLENS